MVRHVGTETLMSRPPKDTNETGVRCTRTAEAKGVRNSAVVRAPFAVEGTETPINIEKARCLRKIISESTSLIYDKKRPIRACSGNRES